MTKKDDDYQQALSIALTAVDKLNSLEDGTKVKFVLVKKTEDGESYEF